MWVGKTVAAVLGQDPEDKVDKERIKAVLKELRARGILKDVGGYDKRRRETFIYTVVA
jgi:hypothetical protein